MNDDHSNPVEQGSIVWASVTDRNGHSKRRPVVVVTSTDDILMDASIVGVAITSTLPEEVPHTYIELPWSHLRHPTTGLYKRSAAVCNWLVSFKVSDVVQSGTWKVPLATLDKIIDKVCEIHGTDALG